jgi:hypothetical protein
MTDQKQKKSRWLLWVTIGCFFLMLLSPFALYRLSNRAAFNRRVEQLAADGFPVSLDDLQAAYVLPEGQPNAADLYLKAFAARVDPNEAEMELLPVQGNYESSDDQPPYPQEVMAAIRSMLDKNEKHLDLLDQAARMDHCLFPRTFDSSFMISDYLSDIKKAAMLLVERNLYLAQTGQTQALLESTQSSIGLTTALNAQPLLIDHLVAIAMQAMTAANIEDSLNLTALKEEQLVTLQLQMRCMHQTTTFAPAMVTERAAQIDLLKKPGGELMEAYWTNRFPYNALFIIYVLVGQKDKDSVLLLDYYDRIIAAAELPVHEQCAELDRIDHEFFSSDSWLRYGFYMMTPSITHIAKINLRVIAGIQSAETILAIERYRLKYGSLPASLEALVPEFLETVYLDPFDGKPLRYVLRDTGGYTVYCIGEDGIDNGGLDNAQMRARSATHSTTEYDHPFTVSH